MTRDMAWGPALSALGFGALYITLAWLALRRLPSLGKMFVLAALSLGAVFTTLAIPLALSARWTAMAWALEGLGILWLGMQQQQRRMSYSGTALLLLAVGSAAGALAHSTAPVTVLMVFAVLSLCWFAAAWLWRRERYSFSLALLAGGILFWLVALLGAGMLVFGENRHAGFGAFGLLALSVWLWRDMARRLAWPEPGVAVWLLWPAMWLVLLWQIADGQLFSAGWDNLAWCLALPTAVLLLKREAARLPEHLSKALYLTLFWWLLLVVATELWWFVSSLPWGMEAWRSGLLLAAGGAIVMLTLSGVRHKVWPFSVWPVQLGMFGVAPVIPVLVVLLLLANMQDGVVIHQGYWPLVNPLEEGAGFALLALWYFGRFVANAVPVLAKAIRRGLLLGVGVLGFWWLNGLLMRTLAWYGDVGWYAQALWHSRLIQTSFALFWMLTALIVMLLATRHASRREWLVGAALLGVVIVKLMLVDSARGGGLARAVAFIGVAVLVLIIGYFSPLPPKQAQAGNAGEEQ